MWFSFPARPLPVVYLAGPWGREKVRGLVPRVFPADSMQKDCFGNYNKKGYSVKFNFRSLSIEYFWNFEHMQKNIWMLLIKNIKLLNYIIELIFSKQKNQPPLELVRSFGNSSFNWKSDSEQRYKKMIITSCCLQKIPCYNSYKIVFNSLYSLVSLHLVNFRPSYVLILIIHSYTIATSKKLARECPWRPQGRSEGGPGVLVTPPL